MSLPYWLAPPALAAGFFLAQCTPSEAGDVHWHFVPPHYLLTVCDDLHPWGCVRFTVAIDNPADIDCHIRMSVYLRDLPTERAYVEETLLAECLAGPVEQGR